MTRPLLFLSLLVLGLLVTVQGSSKATDNGADTHVLSSGSPAILKPIQDRHLASAYLLHERVISGGQPDGEEAFQALKNLGVETVISVDGAKPDVGLARKYGMRYVHLPHGYDGVPEDRAKELAKAVRDLPGIVYIHCHHGKHRSPAAAAIACIGNGWIARDAGVAVLKTVGTNPKYRGLYKSVEEAQRFNEQLLDELDVEFRETVELPVVAKAMVDLEQSFDRLQSVAEAGWISDDSDLEPAYEALLLKEQFVELMRTEDVQGRSERFKWLIRDSRQAAALLERELRGLKSDGRLQKVETELENAFSTAARNCKACHQEFRDNPLDEKE